MPTYNQALSDYVSRTFAAEDEVLRRIRKDILNKGLPAIMIGPEEAAFLRFLIVANGARKAVEIGTLGGYSGIWIARALPPDGKLITLEVNQKHADIARENFEIAEVADKVDLRLGDARQILPGLVAEGPYDLVFMDANKDGYPDYLDWALANLKDGGLIAAHNAFAWGGKVIDEDIQDGSVQIMRQFNRRLAEDPNLVATIYPGGDGMAVAVLQK
jgi:caffeoyl-CoA O-methyltransferase